MSKRVKTALILILCSYLMFYLIFGQRLPVNQKLDDGYLDILEQLSEDKYLKESNAKLWLTSFNHELTKISHRQALSQFEYLTNLTDENAGKYSKLSVESKSWYSTQVHIAKRYLENLKEDDFSDQSQYRMLKLISAGSVSNNDTLNQMISNDTSRMVQIFGSTKVNNATLEELERDITKGNYDDRLRVWKSWRDAVGHLVKPIYSELVEHLNKAAKENGYKDESESWIISDFGYETKNLEEMADNVYKQLQPLYKQLHAYVRRKLYEKYPGHISLQGSIPAHILGNMWAQTWHLDNVKPYPKVAGPSVSAKLKEKYTVKSMCKLAESFFTSIGLEKMTDTFWEKSMLVRPQGREVECHGSATDLFKEGDFRIKMCGSVTQGSLVTIHHEMGHIEYFMEYAHQPAIFREGANAAFHEAIGDTIAMSVGTDKHLKSIGLLPANYKPENQHQQDINKLMGTALGKVAFLQYAYLMDKYRWKIFRGEINNTNYNSKWWQMRKEIQGIKPPVARSENDFDPGAKYHIAANIPYSRYFFAAIAQFQFYEAMCKASGHTGSIHTCDFYGSKKAGSLLKSMLKLGRSKPWQEAMKIMTGETEFSAKAMLSYFKPLQDWLTKENQRNKEHIGWET